MTVELLTPFLACFILVLCLQMFLCFKMQEGVWKALPLMLDLLAFFYAGARFLGIISYAADTTGIVEGGLASGVLIGIMALIGLISIVAAWLVYFLANWRRGHSR